CEQTTVTLPGRHTRSARSRRPSGSASYPRSESSGHRWMWRSIEAAYGVTVATQRSVLLLMILSAPSACSTPASASATAEPVPLRPERRAEHHALPGLLLDLPPRTEQDVLVRGQLALGQGPVVVPGTVHQQHLPGVAAFPPHDTTRGDDRRRVVHRFHPRGQL